MSDDNNSLKIIQILNNKSVSSTTSQTTSEQHIDLASLGIDQVQAELLRASLMTFADDWNSPEMSLYDDYDAARANLESR